MSYKVTRVEYLIRKAVIASVRDLALAVAVVENIDNVHYFRGRGDSIDHQFTSTEKYTLAK